MLEQLNSQWRVVLESCSNTQANVRIYPLTFSRPRTLIFLLNPVWYGCNIILRSQEELMSYLRLISGFFSISLPQEFYT